MKEIIRYLKQFIKDDFHLGAYIYVFVFLAAAIFLNYRFDFEHTFLNRHYGKPACALMYFLTYLTCYYGLIIPLLFFKKKPAVLKNYRFWVKSLVIIMIISADRGFRIFTFVLDHYRTFEEHYFLSKIFGNIKSAVFYILPLLLLKLVFDRHEKGFYGIRKKGFFPLPFLLMLFIVLPLIIIASFRLDFLNQYPSFRGWLINPVFDLNKYQMTAIFEVAYGIDFIMTELIFRGALVIGMSALLGKESVIAMCGLYVFIHFGKPAAETISSFFGGYILGVIAYYYRNIIGGMVIHLGLAYMMEAAAFVQLFYLNK